MNILAQSVCVNEKFVLLLRRFVAFCKEITKITNIINITNLKN